MGIESCDAHVCIYFFRSRMSNCTTGLSLHMYTFQCGCFLVTHRRAWQMTDWGFTHWPLFMALVWTSWGGLKCPETEYTYTKRVKEKFAVHGLLLHLCKVVVRALNNLKSWPPWVNSTLLLDWLEIQVRVLLNWSTFVCNENIEWSFPTPRCWFLERWPNLLLIRQRNLEMLQERRKKKRHFG